MLAIPIACASFEVMAGQPQDRHGPWRAALAEAFEFGRELQNRAVAELNAGRLRAPAFLRGALSQNAIHVQQDLQQDYPLELKSPFEGTDSVAGAVWRGADIFGPGRDDGMMKLRFDKGSYELPLHVHEESDRVIIVLRGSGCFHFTVQPFGSFDGSCVETIDVSPPMILVFTRGLLHTFSAPKEALYLLSYHAPFIPLDDPRQYRLPEMRWLPPSVRTTADTVRAS